MSNVLEKICATTREHVERRKTQTSIATLEAAAKKQSSPRGFIASIKRKLAQGDIALITEIKKASPSAGVICTNFDPAALASAYQHAGAACLSVLTDIAYFQGEDDDLIAAREACGLPVLRKDFMIDLYQVTEARAIGADCILLIMAALDDKQARDLHDAAIAHGMDVLIESHDREELDRALKLPTGMIGINNRNLKTLKTDLATTEELARYVPQDRLLVSESGIATSADIARLRQVNAHTFLIGESLLKQGDVGNAMQQLRG